MTDPKRDAKIDAWVALVDSLINLGGLFYGPLRLAAPLINRVVLAEANKLKRGLDSGSIVPDGQGGWVPNSNSRVDPASGKFL